MWQEGSGLSSPHPTPHTWQPHLLQEFCICSLLSPAWPGPPHAYLPRRESPAAVASAKPFQLQQGLAARVGQLTHVSDVSWGPIMLSLRRDVPVPWSFSAQPCPCAARIAHWPLTCLSSKGEGLLLSIHLAGAYSWENGCGQ